MGRDNGSAMFQNMLAHKDLVPRPNLTRMQEESLFQEKRQHIRADNRELAFCGRQCWGQLDSQMVSTGEDTCMTNCMRLHYDARGILLERLATESA